MHGNVYVYAWMERHNKLDFRYCGMAVEEADVALEQPINMLQRQ
jgi:hypothetical protein